MQGVRVDCAIRVQVIPDDGASLLWVKYGIQFREFRATTFFGGVKIDHEGPGAVAAKRHC